MKKNHNKIMKLHLKANLTLLMLAGCFFIAILASCSYHTKKTDDAFDLVKKNRMMSADSNFVSADVIQESLKTETTTPAKKIETPDEWIRFRLDTEKKVHLNEIKINEIKALPGMKSSFRKKLAALEKGNSDLRLQMDQYKEDVKMKWELFQASVNHNVKDINIELDVLKSENKK